MERKANEQPTDSHDDGRFFVESRREVDMFLAGRAERPRGRAANWWLRAYELRALATTLSRMPRSRDGATDGLLAWVKNQRRSSLRDVQRRFLEGVPGWSWAPHDERWDIQCEAVALFIEAERRAPRRRATEPNEQSLGRWLDRAKREAANGNLAYGRLLGLRRVLQML